jgi:hypothetical protein
MPDEQPVTSEPEGSAAPGRDADLARCAVCRHSHCTCPIGPFNADNHPDLSIEELNENRRRFEWALANPQTIFRDGKVVGGRFASPQDQPID